MDKKTFKELEGRSDTDLHSLIDGARGKLSKDPENKEPQETIDTIEGILEERRRATGDDGDDKVKVRAKVRTPIDHVILEKDQEGTITKRQYRALAGRLELLKLWVLIGALACVLCGAGEAKAQQYSWVAVSSNGVASTLVNGGTNTVLANATNSYLAPFSMTRDGEHSFVLSFALTAAGTSNVTAVVEKSIDKTNWVPWFQLTQAANGTTGVAVGTNVDSGAFGYGRLNNIYNTNNTPIATNVMFLKGKKPSRFDGTP